MLPGLTAQQALEKLTWQGAERRYPDDAALGFELYGAMVFLFRPEGKPGSVEVRFAPPEGTGSFWETLR